jgi:hypothetical protein
MWMRNGSTSWKKISGFYSCLRKNHLTGRASLKGSSAKLCFFVLLQDLAFNLEGGVVFDGKIGIWPL